MRGFKKIIVLCGAISFASIFVFILNSNAPHHHNPIVYQKLDSAITDTIEDDFENGEVGNTEVIEEFYSHRQNLTLSELGKILFLNKPASQEKREKFKILIWKDGSFLERRHVRFFSKEKHDIFETCPVKNCEMTYESKDLPEASAVVFLLHRLRGVSQMPDIYKPRPIKQRWIFLTDESPHHTHLFKTNSSLSNYTGVFNWSMSYKFESDVPVPYGRTIPLYNEFNVHEKKYLRANLMSIIPYAAQKQRDVLVAIMSSNCGSKNMRHAYVKELQKYIKVDYYGRCGDKPKNSCPGHFGSDCPALNTYPFYLSFENSNCDQYMTEKVYWNAYSKGSVPIILGTSRKTSELMLPPGSYIHTADYARPADLARHLLFLNQTYDDAFYNFHNWRMNFEVANEHGYFGSPSVHYCRVCEALNYNDGSPKVYNDLSNFIGIEKNCEAVKGLEFVTEIEK